jgi:four helix bundle protein
MNSDVLKARTKAFAHRRVRLAMALPKNALGEVVRHQLIRCGTSVAANYRAACIAQTKPVFTAKISTVLEEADETWFWLDFVIDENLLNPKLVQDLLKEAEELTKLFAASRKTAAGKRKANSP